MRNELISIEYNKKNLLHNLRNEDLLKYLADVDELKIAIDIIMQ